MGDGADEFLDPQARDTLLRDEFARGVRQLPPGTFPTAIGPRPDFGHLLIGHLSNMTGLISRINFQS